MDNFFADFHTFSRIINSRLRMNLVLNLLLEIKTTDIDFTVVH